MYISDEELRCRLAPRHHLTLYHEKAERMDRPLEAAMLIGPSSVCARPACQSLASRARL